MKSKVFLTSGLIFFCVCFLATCDYFATINQVVGGASASVVVRNQASNRSVSRSVDETDNAEVWFYIYDLNYFGDALTIAPNGDRLFNESQNLITSFDEYYNKAWLANSGWYSKDEPFPLQDGINQPASFSVVDIMIGAMRLSRPPCVPPNPSTTEERQCECTEGNIYFFPGNTKPGEYIRNQGSRAPNAIYGNNPTYERERGNGAFIFRDKFARMRVPINTNHLKTEMIVIVSEILECWDENKEIKDDKNNHPYSHIRIVGTPSRKEVVQ